MAGRFPSEWIDEVRDKSDIVSVVSEYVTLQKKGAKHWGLCPFHGEKTPSFSVDQEKQMFYCFGCHAGGNVITFVMNIEHMEFPEAVRHLAERAHMPIPELQRGEDTGPKKDRDRLYAALVEAAKFYHKTLYTPDGAQALEYYDVPKAAQLLGACIPIFPTWALPSRSLSTQTSPWSGAARCLTPSASA